MNTRPFLRYWLPGVVILCLSIGCASPVAENQSVPESGAAKEVSSDCDDSNPATNDNCVAGMCVNEPIVTCPCADDFAAAVTIYDARSGIPMRPVSDVCSDPRGSVGKYVSITAKFDALTPSETGRTTQMFLGAFRSWTFWGTHPISCSAWVFVDSWSSKNSTLFGIAIHKGLSDAELATCESLIRKIAHCPK